MKQENDFIKSLNLDFAQIPIGVSKELDKAILEMLIAQFALQAKKDRVIEILELEISQRKNL